MRLIYGGIFLAALAINFPGWMMFLLWCGVSAPMIALVAHLRGSRG